MLREVSFVVVVVIIISQERRRRKKVNDREREVRIFACVHMREKPKPKNAHQFARQLGRCGWK